MGGEPHVGAQVRAPVRRALAASVLCSVAFWAASACAEDAAERRAATAPEAASDDGEENPAAKGKKAARPDAEPEIVLCDAVRTKGSDDEADALVKGLDGWIFRTSDLAVDYPLEPAAAAGLKRFVSELAGRGTMLSIVLLPPRGALAEARVDRADPLATAFDPASLRAGYHDAVKRLAATGAVVPDLLSAVEAAGMGEGFFWKRDHHWRPEGAKLAMGAVGAAVKAAKGAPSFTPVASQSVFVKKRGYIGSLARRVERECKAEAFPVERYTDEDSQLTGAVTADALLGEPAPPEVVVAGASHTNKGNRDVFNVTGGLREALGTDVLNVGVDGGGYSTGLLSWLDTEAARNHPPKLLVWEISARIPPGLPDFLRQGLPTLAGPCSAPLARGEAAVGSTDVGLVAAPGKVRSTGSYVVIEAEDPGFVVFTVGFETADGKRDEVTVRRSTLLPNSGRFFVEAPSTEAELVRVTLRAGENGASKVKASLCTYASAAGGSK